MCKPPSMRSTTGSWPASSPMSTDPEQLRYMVGQAKAAMGVEALDVLADRGYFKGEEVLACALRPTSPSRSPPDHRLRDGSANRASSTSLKRTPIAVRPTSV